jgi:FMN reductase
MSQHTLQIVGVGGTLQEHSTSRFALDYALKAAHAAGASVELLDLRTFDLPMYHLDKTLSDYGSPLRHFIKTIATADGLLISTAAYHGTLAGVTKNALDFLEFLSDTDYLHNKPVGLIATAGGDQAAVNTINALVHVVHSLRGMVLPLSVPIHNADKSFDGITPIGRTADRLTKMGAFIVETAARFQSVPALA